jgi:hypothetical protein
MSTKWTYTTKGYKEYLYSKTPTKRSRPGKKNSKIEKKRRLLTVNFGTPNMFITPWFEHDYGTNPPLGTLMI